jgi:hypothetical protein
MTNETIIIGIGVLVGLSLSRKNNSNILNGILIGLALSFGLPFTNEILLIRLSFYSFGILTFIFTLYSGLNKKWLNLVVGIFAFISFLVALLHQAYANELKLSMIIPVLTYLLILTKWKKNKDELSVLTILAAYELAYLLNLIEQWAI